MKEKILLVDDEQEILTVLTYYLKKEGYEVETVENGLMAVEKIKNTAYKAVVCDLLMPKLDGIGLLKKVREDKNFLPFLFLSGHAGAKDELEVSSMGAYDLIHKPHMDRVVPALKKLLLEDGQVQSVLMDGANSSCDEFLEILHDTGRKSKAS